MAFAVETNGLVKSFGPVRAVDSADLRVRQGEIYGFLGLNGAGKTTTIRALLGMIRPDAGSVRVLGQSVVPHGRGPWRYVGHLVERPAAYPELTVRENLEVARRLQGIADVRVTSRAIERLALAPYAERRAGGLSTGNLQRLALANIVSVLGWGDWFPWAVPILIGGMVHSHTDRLGVHSYLVVLLAFILGLAATFAWWRSADQAR